MWERLGEPESQKYPIPPSMYGINSFVFVYSWHTSFFHFPRRRISTRLNFFDVFCFDFIINTPGSQLRTDWMDPLHFFSWNFCFFNFTTKRFPGIHFSPWISLEERTEFVIHPESQKQERTGACLLMLSIKFLSFFLSLFASNEYFKAILCFKRDASNEYFKSIF